MKSFLTAAAILFSVAAQAAGPSTLNPPPGFKFSSIPVVQNASYSASNCLGGFNAVTPVGAYAGETVLLSSVDVKSVGGATSTITVYVFDSYPSASTCTDKSTFTLASADLDKLVGAVVVGLVAPQGSTPTVGAAINLNRMFLMGGATPDVNFYYALVSNSSFTPGSVSDIHVMFQGDFLN